MNKHQLIVARKRQVNIKTLQKKCRKFSKIETRGIYYDWAVDLYNKGYKLPAMILLLSTWNFAYFRYAVTSKKFLFSFMKALKIAEPFFKKLINQKLQIANLDTIGEYIKKIYGILSKVKGIRYVGATKIMHLINRKLFVMWDNKIKIHYGFRTSTPNDYLNFLKLMQNKFRNIQWTERKPLTKAIDEYNYVLYSK